jgi:hypothetical protein
VNAAAILNPHLSGNDIPGYSDFCRLGMVNRTKQTKDKNGEKDGQRYRKPLLLEPAHRKFDFHFCSPSM